MATITAPLPIEALEEQYENHLHVAFTYTRFAGQGEGGERVACAYLLPPAFEKDILRLFVQNKQGVYELQPKFENHERGTVFINKVLNSDDEPFVLHDLPDGTPAMCITHHGLEEVRCYQYGQPHDGPQHAAMQTFYEEGQRKVQIHYTLGKKSGDPHWAEFNINDQLTSAADTDGNQWNKAKIKAYNGG